jgi:hypothetical protein
MPSPALPGLLDRPGKAGGGHRVQSGLCSAPMRSRSWFPACSACVCICLTTGVCRAEKKPETSSSLDLGIASNRALHSGDRASNFVYPTLAVGARFGLFRMEVRSQLPFLLLDAAAYIVQFASSGDPNKFPMSAGLNGGSSKMGPAEFLEGDFFLAPWRGADQRLDVGLRLSLRLMDYVNQGVGVSAQWFGAYPAIAWQIDRGAVQLNATALGGPAWSAHGPGGAAGGECLARVRLVGRLGVFARWSLMGQWLDGRHDYPYSARPGEEGYAGWFWMSNMTGGLSFKL